MVFDFDDFGKDEVISDQCQTRDCRKELETLKKENPKFKVTLFAVPTKMTPQLLIWAKENEDWIELALHGWNHNDNYECSEWTYEQCTRFISDPSFLEHFTRGFKAPGWQISNMCYEALNDAGYWVADQEYNNERRPDDLPTYIVGDNSYHGHTWDCCGNGIIEDWDRLLEKVKKTQNFKFVSEVACEQ
jgi:peptidoglycan/xylan/chitin deacetylase (PgdA/CDA1 family)